MRNMTSFVIVVTKSRNSTWQDFEKMAKTVQLLCQKNY